MTEPILRPARLDEAESIDALMKASTADLFPGYYDASQTRSAVRFIAAVDRALIADGTYFVFVPTGNADVHMPDGQVIACVAMEKGISPR